ncbi:hypothetical protein NPIL_699251 [Nephila pilipes]|uniref:Uncharacterized protein n=1 Tax=Nephila pilipes TaxID=299642 RepID=A0A8X6PTI5_NEPPI|nr:hypothetical protein NPIL_699251 [Nephila pilipes]
MIRFDNNHAINNTLRYMIERLESQLISTNDEDFYNVYSSTFRTTVGENVCFAFEILQPNDYVRYSFGCKNPKFMFSESVVNWEL